MSTATLATLVADLHLLTVLAETRSFTQTAQRLGISKASVSMRIGDLERHAGVPLVRRTTRSVSLTEAGQQLVNDTRPAFGRIDDSFTAVQDQAGSPRGVVRVTAPVALGRQHIAPRLADFLRAYPEITVELELTDRFVNFAQEGFDLAIRHTSTPPDTFVAWVLSDTRSLLVASPAYLNRRGTPAHPSELAEHDCLLYLGGQADTWTFSRPAARKAVEPISVTVSGPLKANNSEVLREAVLDGLGIGLLPDFSVTAGNTANAGNTGNTRAGHAGHSSRRLVAVLPGWRAHGFFGERIYALRPRSHQVPRAVQCFVEHLRSTMAGATPRRS
ncbi:LysR family transcriptional regulator [Pigmentiphaga litoralis]|uniref:LysR family transcriptional regulator n=1 Tax=Pigmentiphaga litoralis TaxID=516702 RepID=UPI003B42D88C